MKFGKALATLEDNRSVRRARWKITGRIFLREGVIHSENADHPGVLAHYVPTQHDILADDWVLVPSDVSMSKQKETTQ